MTNGHSSEEADYTPEEAERRARETAHRLLTTPYRTQKNEPARPRRKKDDGQPAANEAEPPDK